MAEMNQNFEPIYLALTTLLLNSASVVFTGDLAAGSLSIANVVTPAPLTPGLAVINDTLMPIGSVVGTVGSGSITVTLGPTGDQLGASIRAGYVSTDAQKARLLRHWTDVPASEQPAMFVTQVSESPEKRYGQLDKWTLDALVYIYCQAPDDRTPVAPTLNALLGAVRGSLGPDRSGVGRARNACTLGGLVFDTWINGKIETDEGYLGQQGVAKVPVRIIQNGP